MIRRARKLGRGVALVGAGMSKFGAFPEKTSRDLFAEAFTTMAKSVDKGLDTKDIEALYVGNFSSDLFECQGHIAPIMADWVPGEVPVGAVVALEPKVVIPELGVLGEENTYHVTKDGARQLTWAPPGPIEV